MYRAVSSSSHTMNRSMSALLMVDRDALAFPAASRMPMASTTAPPADWPELHTLRKPFGVHELRHTLASILSAP